MDKIVVAAFMASFLVLSLPQTAPAQSLDELYQLAKQEGQVNLYGGGAAANYTRWAKVFGWQFMDGLMKNKPAFVMGHLGVAQKIAAGEFALTFDSTTSTAGELWRAGSIELVIPEEDSMPIWPQTAAVFKGAPHPNAAKLYLAWYLSKEQQHRISRISVWSPRADIAPPAGLKPIGQYKLANSFREFITDEAKVVELRKRFEEYIGPVKGEAYR